MVTSPGQWFKLAQMDGGIYLKDIRLISMDDFFPPPSGSEANLFFRHIFIIIFKKGAENPFVLI